jgi:nucleoid DNA-binding protein
MSDGKRLTKSQVIGEIAEKTGLTKKQIVDTFEALSGLAQRELGKKGPGEFVIPDLLKLKVRVTEAKKAEMRKNPFTGEMKQYPAKPASRKVRASAVKKLKDLVNG